MSERDYAQAYAIGKAERAFKALEYQYAVYDETIDEIVAFLVDLFHLATWNGIDLSDEAFMKLIHEARELNSREPQIVTRADPSD